MFNQTITFEAIIYYLETNLSCTIFSFLTHCDRAVNYDIRFPTAALLILYTTGQHMSHMFLKRVVFSSAVVIFVERPPRICSILSTYIDFVLLSALTCVHNKELKLLYANLRKITTICSPYMNKDT